MANPLADWAAYIGGSIFTLLKEESIKLPYGFSFLLLSAVPMNVGIGSSAAVEIGTLSCLNAYLGPATRRRAHRAARPDGGKPRRRRAVRHHGPDRRCQRPRRQAHAHPLPARLDCRAKWRSRRARALSASTRWSAIPSPATPTATSASARSWANKSSTKSAPAPAARALNYLAELSSERIQVRNFEPEIPETILGSDFLAKYKTHDDPVTTIQPDATYRVAGPTRHPVEENERVLKFIAALQRGQEWRRKGARDRRRNDVWRA